MDAPTKDLKTFAYIWAVIFFFIGVFPLFKSDFSTLLTTDFLESLTPLNILNWPFYVCIIFFLIGTFIPAVLSGVYQIWMKFGELIGSIISKVILLFLFYCLFTPFSIALKIMQKDLLHKKLDKKCHSYWLDRKIQPGSLKKQF